MSIFGRVVKALDIISPTTAFNVNGKDRVPRVQSISGGIFVIVSFLTLLLYAIYAIWDFTRYSLLSSSQLVRYSRTSPIVDLKQNRLLPVISVVDTLIGEYVNPENIQDYIQFYFELDISNPDVSVKERKYVPFLITPCSKLEKDERKRTFGGVKFSDVETEEALNNSLCVTPIKENSSLSILGIIHRNKSMIAKLYVYPCDENNLKCKARKRDETLSLLTNLKINIGFITSDFDLGDYHRPIGFSLDYSRYYFL